MSNANIIAIIIGTVFGIIGLAVFGYIMNKLRKNVPAIIHAFIDSNDGGKVYWYESNTMSKVKTLIMFMTSPMPSTTVRVHHLMF